jgi:hypothetical protein
MWATLPSGNETIIQGVTGDKVVGSENLFTFGVTKRRYVDAGQSTVSMLNDVKKIQKYSVDQGP